MSPIQPILFAAALYNLVLVGIILAKTHTNQAGRSFAWFILSTTGWMICVALMHPRLGVETTLWLARATFACGVGIGMSAVWFSVSFPTVDITARQVARVLIRLGLPWLLVAWTPWLIQSVSFQHGWVDAKQGDLVTPYAIWIVACGLVSVLTLLQKARKLHGLARLQARYILLGIAGLALFGPVPSLILPRLTDSTQYAFYGPLASLFLTTAATYAIARYRLMDITIVLRAGLVYSLTIGGLALVFALLVPVLDTVLTGHLHTSVRVGSFLTAFCMALAFQPLRHLVGHVVDRRFFKSVYDYRRTLREAGSALASARDRNLLVGILMNALTHTLRPRGVAVFTPGTDDRSFALAAPVEGWTALPPTLPDSDPVLAAALVSDEVLVTDELLCQPAPHNALGQRLQAWGVFVLVPLIAGNRLCGVVCLGEKLSGDVYTVDDIGLLRILGTQAAVALDNVRHYDEMVLLNEYHERLLHAMQDGVIALDPEGRIITFNPAAEAITGVGAEETLGQTLTAIGLPALPCEDTGEQAIEVELPTRLGVTIPALVTVTPFRRRWDMADSHLIVFRDLSDLRALEQDKLQAERFSSMGAMAASIAHEIKNPLVPIQTFAHLLPQMYHDAEFREEFSHTVVYEVERINRLVSQMLDLVRKPSYDRAPVDLEELINRLLVIIRPECERHHIRVVVDLPPTLPTITGVAGQLYQAILNVLMNAVQAMGDDGELAITITHEEQLITCRIADNGPGVPPDHLARIFEPLFTTKVGGHGLGLALTYQFVRSHGGEIRAECAPGAGLTVIITLPACLQAEVELVCT
jgi:two-component system NtrC family sensor kinase